MEEEKKNEGLEETVRKEEKSEEGKPFCTTAPSAEHARASHEDEVCDDYRTGA